MSRAIEPLKSVRSHLHEILSEKGRYTYLAEDSAKPLIDWLNSGSGKNRDRAEKLTALFRAAQRTSELTEFLRLCDEIDRLNKKLRLRFEPRLETRAIRFENSQMIRGGHRWKFTWVPIGSAGTRDAFGDALVALYQLASQGLVSRVCKCEAEGCGMWFCARFSHQQFHSKRCQERTFQTSPEWRERRREYMRKKRRDDKEREQLEREQQKRRLRKRRA